jgi:hypothetical protein
MILPLLLPISTRVDALPDISKTLVLDALKVKGKTYNARVPDTLDLVDRANLSINVLTQNVEPDTFYGVYQGLRFNKLPIEKSALTWNITPKNARTLPCLRIISGSDCNLDVEYAMMKDLLAQIDPDGKLYYPFDGGGPPKGSCYPQISALTLFAALNFYERDHNPLWKEWIDLLAKGLRETAIQVDDRAYYPMQSGIDREGKWHFMHHEGSMPIPYTPPDEPKSDAEGLEGAAKSDQCRCMSALAMHYRLTDNQESLEMAKKISRFVMKPALWEDRSKEGLVGSEEGLWSGHFHNGTNGLLAILDFAMATNDDKLKQVVRQGYDCARQNGNIRIGFFPAWSRPWLYNRPNDLSENTEPCALGDMVCLAVMLSDAGLGDYWDDAESILRNTLLSQQVTDIEKLRNVAGAKEGSKDESTLKQFMGGFTGGSVCALGIYDIAGCCSVNGAQGIYYGWNGITRFDKGVATVNLFLNRASPWMDIDSYIPYEGKVVLHNKTAHTAMVRIPGWVEKEKVKTFVNDKPAKPATVNEYLMVASLKAGDTIRIEFPIHSSTSKYTFHGEEYSVEFRGNTVTNITPDDSPPNYYKYYPLTKYDSGKAPIKSVKRFAANSVIPLGPF